MHRAMVKPKTILAKAIAMTTRSNSATTRRQWWTPTPHTDPEEKKTAKHNPYTGKETESQFSSQHNHTTTKQTDNSHFDTLTIANKPKKLTNPLGDEVLKVDLSSILQGEIRKRTSYKGHGKWIKQNRKNNEEIGD